MNPIDGNARRRWTSIAFLAACAALAPAAHAQTAGYNLIDLGPASPSTLQSAATGINQAGSVSGYTLDGTALTYSAFRFDSPSTIVGLPAPDGFDSFYANGIATDNTVAGTARVSSSSAFQAAYNDTVSTFLIPLPGSDAFSAATGVNVGHTIVGHSYDTSGHFHAFVYQSGGDSTLLPTGAVTNSDAYALNDSGQIAAAADDATFHFHAVLGGGGSPVTLAGLPGATDTYACGINAVGDVVGESASDGASHAVIWHNGSTTAVDLGLLSGSTYGAAKAVNTAGVAVGDSADNSYINFRATLWDAAGAHDLNTMVPAGIASTWTLQRATGINDAGQISGIGLINGQQHGFLLNVAKPAKTFQVVAPANVTAGVPFTITVSALDANGNATTNYAGTVHFTIDTPNETLPVDAALTNGVGTFSFTLKTARLATIRARDTSTSTITGTAMVNVSAAAVDHLTLTAPATVTAGTAFYAMLTAFDAFNNVVKTYSNTIHFTSSDSQAVLPTDLTLTSGSKQVSIKLKTPGNQTITATDTSNSSLTVTSANVNVGVTFSKLVLTIPTTATAGNPTSFTVTAQDTVGNIVPSYNGTVHITSTDTMAVLPGDVTLVNGAITSSITLKTAATQTTTATSTTTSTIKATGVTVVSAAPASQIVITAPASATSGAAFYATLTAKDAYGNLAKTYAGTVHFTSTDVLAVLPANTTLANGTKQVAVKLKTQGNQTISATDTVNPAVTGTSMAIAVN